MAPFYPPAWPFLLLPVWLGMPLVLIAHALAAVVTFRWFARCLRLSATSSTLVGVSVMAGASGVIAIMDGGAGGVLAMFVWLPVSAGAIERLACARTAHSRSGWAALAAAALALMFLGTHTRIAVAAAVAVGLWCLVRGIPIRWTAVICSLGLACGAPGYVPLLMEFNDAFSPASQMGSMDVQSGSLAFLWSVAHALVPDANPFRGGFGPGVVMLVALLSGSRWRLWSPSLRRLGILVACLTTLYVGASIPILRTILSPLLLPIHPLEAIYLGLASLFCIPLAGRGLEHLLERTRGAGFGVINRVGAVVLGVWMAAFLVGVASSESGTLSEPSGLSMAVGTLQSLVVLAVCVVLLVRAPSMGSSRFRTFVFLLAILDLGSAALRQHVTYPAPHIQLADRTDVPGVERLSEGYLDIEELKSLEGLTWGVFEEDEDEEEDAGGPDGTCIGGEECEDDDDDDDDWDGAREWEISIEELKRNNLDRTWPLHLGVARGYRCISGRAKLPSPRARVMLEPVAIALNEIGEQGVADPHQLDRLFESPQGVGARVMSLFGVPVAAGQSMTYRIDRLVPWCYSPSVLSVEPDERARVEAILGRPFALDGPALLETPIDDRVPLGPASVTCEIEGIVEVGAPGRAVVALRERYQSGWRVTDESGERLQTFPVNQVHLGVLVDAGQHRLSARFVPSGVFGSGLVAALGLGVLGALFSISVVRRRR